jgi:hypothetical protein
VTLPEELTRDEIVKISDAVLGRADLPLDAREDVFRIRVLELDWDIGGKVYEPADASRVPVGADGKKAGLFLIHGGGGDHRSMEPLALLLARKFGFKVATITYPGQLYLPDPSRAWPGDTIHPDGTARTPIWKRDELITPDQYDFIQDRSNPRARARWGTLFLLRAKEGSVFYDRMAAWPMAMEVGMQEVCRRNLPAGEYSVYVHGHSTGGPFAHMLLQRADGFNVGGLVGTETSAFGRMYRAMHPDRWEHPFNVLSVRTWRDIARYRGPEAGPEGMWRLPWLMEDILDEWEGRKHLPNIKAQYLIHYGDPDGLEAAARAVARRLGSDAAETQALVERFRGYVGELSGPGVRPLPPLLYGITRSSRDHTREMYEQVLLPMLAAIEPPPKVHLTRFQAGVHSYLRPEPGLPSGVGPAMGQLWLDAITKGFYVTSRPARAGARRSGGGVGSR